MLYATVSTLGLAAWLIIPSALAGAAMHYWETRQTDREAVEASRRARWERQAELYRRAGITSGGPTATRR